MRKLSMEDVKGLKLNDIDFSRMNNVREEVDLVGDYIDDDGRLYFCVDGKYHPHYFCVNKKLFM